MKKLLFLSLILIASLTAHSQDPQFSWANVIGSSTVDTGNDVTQDPSGNPIFVGQFTQGADFDPGAGTFGLFTTGTSGFVQKLAADNTLEWAAALLTGSSAFCSPQAVTTDNSGNIYVTGYFNGSVDFDPAAGSSTLTSSAGIDGFILKLSSSGSFQWVRQIEATLDLRARSIAVDGSSNVFVVGNYEGSIDLNTDAGVNNRLSQGQQDLFIIKVNSNGIHQWGYGIGGSGQDEAHAVAVNSQNDIYVAGLFRSINAVFSTAPGNAEVLSSVGNQDIFVLKIDGPTAITDWAKSTGGSSSESVQDMVIGNSDDLYMTGHFSGTADFNPAASTVNQTSSGLSDIFVLKWNSNGFYLWSRKIGGSNNDFGDKIALDNSDNVYVTGNYSGTADFDPGAGTVNLTASGTDSYVVKLDSDGLYSWAGNITGAGSNFGKGIAADATNIYVTGLFTQTTDFDPGAAVDNQTSNGSNDIFNLKLSTNNDPTDIALSNSSTNENNAINTTIGSLSSADIDAGDTHTYSLVAGLGDTDNASFNINGSALRIGVVANHEVKDTYNIRIQTSDANGGVFSKAFTIAINDRNDAPTDITVTPDDIDENAPDEALVGTIAASDEDVGDIHTFSLVSGAGDTNNSTFSIQGGTNLRMNGGGVSHEASGSLSIRLRAVDSNSGAIEKVVTITINDVPEAPTDLDLSASVIAENNSVNAVVGSLSTTDEDAGENYSYSLVNGTGDTDNAAFNISGSQLRASQAFDFETKNSYSVRVQTNDGNGGTFAKQFNISVTDVAEAPTDLDLSNSAIAENNAVNAVVGSLSTTDQDAGETYTYSLVSGTGDTDNAAFNISGNQLRASEAFDFEIKNSFSVRVQTNDGNSGTFTRQLSISITDISEAPTDLDLNNSSIAENNAVNATVGSLSTTDQDAGETYSYSLVSGTGDTDNAAFNISGSQLRASQTFDFETKSSYSVRIQTNDGNSGTFAKQLSISVTDIGEAPTDLDLSSSVIAENNAVNAAVGSLSTIDQDAGETYSYSLVSGTGDTDNAAFNIAGSQLRASQAFDFETKNSYSVRVQTNDGNGGTLAKQFSISVTDIGEAPTDLDLNNSSINENNAVNAVIGALSTTDQDAVETYSYSLVSGTGDADNAAFNISGSQLRASQAFDFESKDTYSIRIQTNDGNGGTFSKSLTINIINVFEAPTNITFFGFFLEIPENNSVNDLLSTFSTVDPDAGEAYTYTLVSGSGDADNASFTIVGSELRAAEVFNFETKNSYSIRVQTNDGNGGIFSKQFSVSINNVFETPTDLDLSNSSIIENNGVNTTVGSLSTTDQDAGETYTYSLISGAGDADNAAFNISGSQLRAAQVFDFETKNSYSIRVQTDDGNGGTYQESLSISVTNESEMPTDLMLSSNSIDESAPTGTTVGTLSTEDEDNGEIHTYTLVVGTGDADNASFAIVEDELQSAEIFDFETKTSYSIRIQTDDGNGGLFEKAFTVSINDLPPGLTGVGITSAFIDENLSIGSSVGDLFALGDEIGGVSFTFSLVTGSGDTDNASFSIVGEQLRSTISFDFEVKNQYSIRVMADDGAGSAIEQIILIDINDINEFPTDIQLSVASIDENNSVNDPIGTFSTTDVDAGDSHSWSLVAGSGDDDNTSFNISGNKLQASESFDFETKSSYSIRVETSDGNGGTYPEVFSISVDDRNDDPTELLISASAIDENNVFNEMVGSFTTTDQDSGDSFTYSLVSGAGDTDNGSFIISGNQLQTGIFFNFELKTSYSVRVQSGDGNGGQIEQTFVITVNDVNENPSDIALSGSAISESNPTGTIIGSFSSVDEDAGQSHTYTLVTSTGDEDNSSFTISGNEILSAEVFDFETKNSYSIRVRSEDGNGGTFEEIFTISITDLPASITSFTLSSDAIDENLVSGTVLGTLATTGEDLSGSFTYTLVSGTGDTDNPSFTISGDQVLTSESFNFETKNSYSIRVMTDDGNRSEEKTFTISVNNIPEAPTAILLSTNTIDENNAINDVIGTLSTTDEDAGETFTYSLVSGTGDTENVSFIVSGNELQAGETFDFESKSSYSIRVETNDGNGGTLQTIFTISINDLDENLPPTVANPLADVTQVEGFSTLDIDLTNTFSDSDGDALTLSVASSNQSVVTASIAGNTLTLTETGVGASTITVTATDGNGGTVMDEFSAAVNEVINNTPTVANPLADVTQVEGFSTLEVDLTNTFDDQDGDVLTFAASSSNESVASVSISGNILTLTETGIGMSSITVTAGDGNGASVGDEFSITVNEAANNTPTVVNPLADVAQVEGFVSLEVDLTNTFDDPDGDALTFSAISSDESVVTVSIAENTLTLTETGVGTSSITVTADDGNGGSISNTFTFLATEAPLGFDNKITIEVYPNPATDFVDIKSTEVVNIHLTDLKGQSVKSDSGESVRMNLRDLRSGIYILRITNGESTAYKRIIKAN